MSDSSQPHGLVHGILQARILEWVAFPFSSGSSRPKESNQGLLHCRSILYQLSYQRKKNLACNAGDAGSNLGRGTKSSLSVQQLSPLDTTTEPMHSDLCTTVKKIPCDARKMSHAANRTRCSQINVFLKAEKRKKEKRERKREKKRKKRKKKCILLLRNPEHSAWPGFQRVLILKNKKFTF